MKRWTGFGAHALAVLFVAAAVTYLYSDLFSRTAFLSHEQFYAYIRAHEVALEFAAGRMPQSFPDAIYGAGFAFPRFYPPFTLWLSAWLTMLFSDACLGVNLAFFLSVLFSGFAMYFAANSIARDRLIAVAITLLYVSMPYRFVDVFVRGALAEAWTFVWYPLIVAGLWRAVTRRVLPWYLPVAVGLLLVTHNITALFFLCFCTLLCMAAYVWRRNASAAIPVLGIALGVGLALWFLLPQQYYLKGVLVSNPAYMWADDLHVQEHRVMPWQYFYSHWNYWQGESFDPSYVDRMSFELGAGQLMLLPLALAFYRKFRDRALLRRRPLAMLGVVSAVCYAGSLVFMIWPIVFLTVLPKQFSFIQFPWRMLAIAAFLSSLAMVAFARCLRLSERARWLLVVAALVIVAAVPGYQRRGDTLMQWHQGDVLAPAYVAEKSRSGYTVLSEYLPKEFDAKGFNGKTLADGTLSEPLFPDGSGTVASFHRNGLDMGATVTTESPSVVVFPLVYYDFYAARADDGHALPMSSIRGYAGVSVPSGSTSIEISQRITSVTKIGFVLSLLALLATAAACIALRKPFSVRRDSTGVPIGPSELVETAE